jgi:hypothetical protein
VRDMCGKVSMGHGWLNNGKVRRLEWVVFYYNCCVSRESMELGDHM